jgi:AI-2 transport protein TqsA
VENNKVLQASSGIVAVFVIGVFLRLAKSVVFPFFLALFIYFILSPVLDFLVKRLKISKAIAVVTIFFLTFFILYLMGIVLYTSGKTLATDLPAYGEKFNGMLNSLQADLKLSKSKIDLLSWAQNLDIDKIGTFLISSLGTFLDFISKLLLVLIFLIFMLAGRGQLNVKIRSSFSGHRAGQWTKIVDNIDSQIQKYLAIKTIICLLSGVLATIIMIAFGVNYAVLFGLITFVLNYIPNIGAFVAKIIPFLVGLLQFESGWRAIWMLVVLLAVDAVVGMIIEPRLMGSRLGLSPLAILVSLFLWGWLWGIPGMILSVPIMVILKIISANIPSLRFFEVLLSK